MIDRLNFYDLYGYLLPGLAVLGVLWFPLWVVAGKQLPDAWSSAIIALAFCYVIGHLLQQLARDAFPQGFVGGDGSRRFPSDYLLDTTNEWLSAEYPGSLRGQHLVPEVRAGVVTKIAVTFGLDVGSPARPGLEVVQRRQDAFLLCRRALLQRGAGSYAEQFEGMYAMMRGLLAAATFSLFYNAGWAFGWVTRPWAPGVLAAVTVYLVLATAVVTALVGERSRIFWGLTTALFPLGLYLSGSSSTASTVTPERMIAFGAVLIGSWLARQQFQAAYRFFAVAFAATVYRDFYVLMRLPSPKP
jgi:hypothetical protein